MDISTQIYLARGHLFRKNLLELAQLGTFLTTGSARLGRSGADRWTSFGVTRLAQNSARGHFGVTWLAKTRLEVTSRSRKLEKTRLEVTSKSRKLRKLGSKSFRGGHFRGSQNMNRRAFLSFSSDRLAQNSARGHFGVTCLEKTRFGVTSGSLRGHLARENSARSQLEVETT